MEDYTPLEQRLGYIFQDKSLLARALTHPSLDGKNNYERLEFLGDAVIELCVSLELFQSHPRLAEGRLTRMRAELVCSKSLAAAARRLGVGEYLRVGKGEEKTGGRDKTSILENTVEAMLGAVFLDGGFDAAQRVAKNIIARPMARANDYKSLYQERVQQSGAHSIEYCVTDMQGPPHDRTFCVALFLDGQLVGEGRGKSKKNAEQEAARDAMEQNEK